MYKLLIIEDEPIEREALKMMIQGSCEKISQVEEAENGFDAIRKCRDLPPNIVIADLNMPGINGLETIRELKKIDASMRYLILSAYNQFEFAQEAIQLGVEDFIVKPAKLSDLQQSLEKIINKIEQANTTAEKNTALLERMDEIRPILENNCIHAIAAKAGRRELEKMFSFLDFTVESGFCFGVSFEKTPRMLLGAVKNAFEGMGITCIGEQLHNLLVFFVLDKKPLKERRREEVGRFVKMLLTEENRRESSVGVGKIYHDAGLFHQSYQEAVLALQEAAGQEGKVFYYDSLKYQGGQQSVNLDHMAGVILETLNRKEQPPIKECVGWILTELFVKREAGQESRELFYQLMAVLAARIQAAYPDIRLGGSIPLEAVLKSESIQEAETYGSYQLNYFREAIGQYRQLNHNLAVSRALSYIEQNYDKNISLGDVAEELQISIYYLSKIFKKHTGKNFTDLLAEKRIEAAKELLKQNLSVKEVTYRAGFNSQNYFTKVFKKYVGCTPKEYKG